MLRRALLILGAIGSLILAATAFWRDDPVASPPRGSFAASVHEDRAVVWAVGDTADGGRDSARVAALIRRADPDRFLFLGDIYGGITGDGSAVTWRENYAPIFGPLARRTAPTPGNHEWPQRAVGYRPYWRRATGRAVPDYYAFRVAGWQLLSLNSQADHDAGSPQVSWLRRQVRGGGTCRLAFWHRPRFSTGGHGDNPDVAPLWDALRGHAVLAIHGHDHVMQRLKPIDGITTFVSGAGGRRRYDLDRDPRRAWGSDDDFGALRIVLRPGVADLAFVAVDGRVLDRDRVRCDRR